MSKILISNGNIGAATAALLATQHNEVSLLVRKPEISPALKALGVTATIADAAKPETLAKAFEGVDSFFFISPLVENMVELATNLIEAATRAGVKHIVRSSANGADPEAPIAMGKLHGQVERLIKNSGIAYSIIRPASFFQNIYGSIAGIKSQQVFYGSAGEGKNGLVDVEDIAAVAATIIADRAAHNNKTYVLTGPEVLSNYDLADILSTKLGTRISYVDLPAEELGKAYKGYGMDTWTINAILELDKITKLGYVANLSEDVKLVTGKIPGSFEAFVSKNLAAFK
ncbi:MAG TPA: NmrA family NAD(P)-binding protein [Chitinophagaceae bacterium]|nr:NmrA family NAD(P)-binding protein [Chitinophagaceae bacterium]